MRFCSSSNSLRRCASESAATPISTDSSPGCDCPVVVSISCPLDPVAVCADAPCAAPTPGHDCCASCAASCVVELTTAGSGIVPTTGATCAASVGKRPITNWSRAVCSLCCTCMSVCVARTLHTAAAKPAAGRVHTTSPPLPRSNCAFSSTARAGHPHSSASALPSVIRSGFLH